MQAQACCCWFSAAAARWLHASAHSSRCNIAGEHSNIRSARRERVTIFRFSRWFVIYQYDLEHRGPPVRDSNNMPPRRCPTVAVIACLLHAVAALDNGAGKTPPLGWNTWKTCGEATCGHDICNEAEVRSVAQALQDNGMQALGWNYVNLDDCWALQRDPTKETLQWDPTRFPSGLPALIDWLHAKGFKFGLYTR